MYSRDDPLPIPHSAQLRSAYHHGEASLQQTIIGMAQNFVGSPLVEHKFFFTKTDESGPIESQQWPIGILMCLKQGSMMVNNGQ